MNAHFVNKFRNSNSGQSLLLMVVVTALSSVVILSGFMLYTTNLLNQVRVTQGKAALRYAESGVEEGIIRVLRLNSFTNETFTMDNATVNVSVTGSDPYTVTGTAVLGNVTKKSQAVMTKNGNKRKSKNWNVTITSWSEIP